MKYIDVNYPEYRGAKIPEFNPAKINESKFEDELRYKSCCAALSDNGVNGEVEWLSQESEHPSDEFNAEVIRAFKEAGAKDGCVIKVDFGLRDNGLTEHYELKVS